MDLHNNSICLISVFSSFAKVLVHYVGILSGVIGNSRRCLPPYGFSKQDVQIVRDSKMRRFRHFMAVGIVSGVFAFKVRVNQE